MKRKFKISLTILVTALILAPIIYVLSIFYIGFYQEYKANEKGVRNIEGQILMKKMTAKIDRRMDIMDKAWEYEKTGQYELAIQEYKKVIELGDGWSGHARLADVYEKSGKYDLAIKELDWLIAQKPRQEVMDEYLARKQKLEAKLNSGK